MRQPQVWIELGAQLNVERQPGIICAGFPVDAAVDLLAVAKPRESSDPWPGRIRENLVSAGRFELDILGLHPLWPRAERQAQAPADLSEFASSSISIPSSARYASMRLWLSDKTNPVRARFADTQVRNSEQHTILDFQAGKDVGLGLFGKDTSSTVSLGVRFAQFRDKANIALKSDPDWHFQRYIFHLTLASGLPFPNDRSALS